MKIVSIAGHVLQFDFGTNMLISSVTGLDALSPIENHPINEQGAALLYGGLARKDEKDKKPVQHSYEQCKELIKDFSGKEYGELVTAWLRHINIIPDEDAPELNKTESEKLEEEEKKKG